MSNFNFRVVKFATLNQTTVVRSVPILHQGWELDDLLYVCADGRVISTDHGAPEFAEMGYLTGKQQEYRDLVEAYETLLDGIANKTLQHTT